MLGAAGLAATFAPGELLSAMGAPSGPPLLLVVQLIGALYFGFAFANWTAKGSIIGGIYARPLTLGNCSHFVIGALALVKFIFAHGPNVVLVIAAIVYVVFAGCFGYLIFGKGAGGGNQAAC